MAIARSGTPYEAHNAAAPTASVTVPATASAGALGIIVAFWNTTGSWGAIPSGWAVVPNSTQTTTAPACIAYYKILAASDLGASVTVTGPGSFANSVCAFAYAGSQGFDASGAQRNGSGTTCTAPAVTATGLADMLVMVGGVAITAATLSAPTNGLSLWQATASASLGIADKQLSAAGSTGSSAMTISAANVNAAIQFTLFQLDSDGEGTSSSGARRAPMRGWNPARQSATSGRDDHLVASLTEDTWSVPPSRLKPLRGFRVQRVFGEDEQSLATLNVDEAWWPAGRSLRGLQLSRAGDEQPPPAMIEEASTGARRMFKRLRPTVLSGDEWRTIVHDDLSIRRVRLARLRLPAAVTPGVEWPATVFADAACGPPVRRWDRLRRWLRQIAEDFGIVIVAAPSFRFAATLDPSVIFAGATLCSTALFGATLDPPLMSGATLG